MPSEKIKEEEVEVLNSVENPEKIIESSSKNDEGEFFKNSPLGKILENVEEMKKIRGFFLASVLMGFTSLFVFHIPLGIAAIISGVLDLIFGSKITKKASYTGIAFGLIAIIMTL